MTIGASNKGDTNMIIGGGNKEGNTNIIMGSNNDKGDTLVAIGKGNTNGKTTIDIGDLGNNTTVNVSGDTVNISGDKSINLKAPDVNVDGNFNVNGNGHVKGDLTVDGTLKANDIELSDGRSFNGEVSRLNKRINTTGAHAAALAALHPGEWDEDTKLSVSAGMGAYSGSKAMALGAFYRPTDKIMFSIGGTAGGSENMMNLGVTFGLDANPHAPRSTKKEMTQDIVALKAENEVLKDTVEDIQDKLNQLIKALNVKEIQK